MIAAAAMMGGGSYGASSVMEIHPPEHDQPSLNWMDSGRRRRNKTSARSQRQLRKDKRRAHAAGSKRAFSA